MPAATIDTASVTAEDRLDFWCSTVCDQFVALDVKPMVVPELHGRVTALSLGETRLRRIAGSAHTFDRTDRLVRSAGEEYFQIALARRGSTVVTQDGRAATITPGEFVLYDSSRPFTFVTDGDFDYSVCLVPKRELPLSRREFEAATAIAFDGRRGVAAMLPPLLAAMHRIEPDELTAASLDAMSRTIADLFVALVRDRVEPAAAPNVHLLRARAHIAEHLGDPTLSPAGVAVACAISVSYLHKLFGEAGTTVTEHIREQRLQGCWEELRQPALARLGVGAIGARWGLTDSAHFSRAFRARFGLPPSEHRARALGSP